MGMGAAKGGGGGRGRIAQASLSEINVTPLVDVMLVLLVIFMVASAVETARISREAETLRQVATEEAAAKLVSEENQVPVDLPRVTADKINLAGKNTKPIISFDAERKIYVDKDLLIDCKPKTVDQCLDGFEAALAKHPKGHGIRDANLRADRHLDYGLVLALMARMRRAGIEHFGLISEDPGK
ncbi:MAG: biopolymer transporter ExbD [Deltaproteobacteria bacterium]|nr:biopolymer transporter ExbD [Deltaproteobacteria bacterium]